MAKSKVEFEEGWPVDEDGNPMVKISFAASNTVKTAEYSNIIVGPASATKFVSDQGQKELANEIVELAKPVEWAIGWERDRMLKELAGETTGEAEGA